MSSTLGYSLFFPDDNVTRPAALLFHGLTGAPNEMAPLAEKLHSNGFDILAPCFSGHGTSIDDLRTTPASRWLAEVDAAFVQISQRTPSGIYCAGLSFGGMLTLPLAIKNPEQVKGLAILAPPIQIRSAVKEYAVRALSNLPDSLLNRLGVIQKKPRDVQFVGGERAAYGAHSIAAVARAKWILRMLWSNLDRVKCPVILLQDPEDHHVAPAGGRMLQKNLSAADVTLEWIEGSEHEMTIGPKAEDVNDRVVRFFLEIESKQQGCRER